MQLIHDPLPDWNRALPRVALPVERLILRKRRWRGVAADGTEFGFDLRGPLAAGDVFFQSATAVYHLAQRPEPILEISLSGKNADEAARLGWHLGNLHFPLAIADDGAALLVADDPAVRQTLTRENIVYRTAERVFRPLTGGHSHGLGHGH